MCVGSILSSETVLFFHFLVKVTNGPKNYPELEPFQTKDEQNSSASFLITDCKMGHGKPEIG